MYIYIHIISSRLLCSCAPSPMCELKPPLPESSGPVHPHSDQVVEDDDLNKLTFGLIVNFLNISSVLGESK